MRGLYFLSVWLHIVAAILWIGGTFFLILVVVPWLRSGSRDAATLLRETAGRFRAIAWACFAVVLVTGTFNLWIRGVRPGHFASAEWLASPSGSAIAAKLLVFVVVLLLSARHDFVIGPRAGAAIRTDPGSVATQKLRRQASVYGRANALLALVLVMIGVAIVRGWPW